MRGPFMGRGRAPRPRLFHRLRKRPRKDRLAFKPALRLRELQQGCPLQLTLLADMPGSRAVEMYLHEFYATDRVRGEWFKQSERLMAYIEKLAR
jgi:hypothetical protein